MTGLVQSKWSDKQITNQEEIPTSTSQELVFLRERYSLRNDTVIQTQRISTNNTIIFENVEYSLDGLEQFSITSDEHKRQSNISIPLWKKSDKGATIIVVKDDNVIQYISIQTAYSRGDLIAIRTDQIAQENVTEYITVIATDYDEDRFQAMKAFDNMKKTIQQGSSVSQQLDDGTTRAAKALKCSTHKTIEVAVAYDASMCDDFSGDKSRTDAHIEAIVGLASIYYESSCVKLSLVHIDGTCDKSRDPYKQIATSKSILEEFTAEWREKKQYIKRDVAHLFSGTSFENGVLGWAWKSTLCSQTNGYGANWIRWSDNIALRASLFAHELGHNAGANHFGEGCSNWLMAPCGPGLAGFSEESQQAVINFVNKQDCLDNTPLVFRYPSPSPMTAPPIPVVRIRETIPPQRTQRPIHENTPNLNRSYSNSFELRTKAVTSHCLTVDVDYAVSIQSCDDSEAQKWEFNRDSGHMRNVVTGECLVPDISNDSSVKTRLAVQPCPVAIDDTFRWRFSSGFIRNASGTVIEAARAIKRFDGNEKVLLIPVLSSIDDSKSDFQTWDRLFI